MPPIRCRHTQLRHLPLQLCQWHCSYKRACGVAHTTATLSRVPATLPLLPWVQLIHCSMSLRFNYFASAAHRSYNGSLRALLQHVDAQLYAFTRFVTPISEHRRFDTTFFIAHLPSHIRYNTLPPIASSAPSPSYTYAHTYRHSFVHAF